MRDVVITGLGVVSSIGNDAASCVESLRDSRSGLGRDPEMQGLGYKCQVSGRVGDLDMKSIPKQVRHATSPVGKYAVLATIQALSHAGIAPEELHLDARAGAIVGSSFSGAEQWFRAEELLEKHRNPTRLGATGVIKAMHFSLAGNLATWLKLNGRSYALCSSFATGIDAIGHASELVARGELDLCICGAAEQHAARQFCIFAENWGGMPTAWNDRPEGSCRPYDRDRSGTVFSEGAGILVIESADRARDRGAAPIAEIVGYGSANDGHDMFRPSGDGLRAAVGQAVAAAKENSVDSFDYVNPHGTGTKVHDALEVEVIKESLPGQEPMVTSFKGLAGHAMAAAGAVEMCWTLLQMRERFVAPAANLDNVAPECEGVDHVRELRETAIGTALCFNVGLGGTNACLALRSA